MKLREFTEQDWYGFSGAEPPEKGQPLIGETRVTSGDMGREFDCIVIVDATGLSFYGIDEDGEDIFNLHLELEFSVAKFLAQNLIQLGPLQNEVKRLER